MICIPDITMKLTLVVLLKNISLNIKIKRILGILMGTTEEQITELKDQLIKFIKDNSEEWRDRKYKRKAKRKK